MCQCNQQVIGLSWRRPVIAAATVTKEETMTSSPAPATSRFDGSEVATTTAAATLPVTGKSKWAIDENENLKSTMEHRLWVFGSIALMSGSLAQAANQAQALGPEGWIGLAAAMLASYVLSDLGTGIYHWSVDNYGDGKTPLVGKQIAAFQVGSLVGLDSASSFYDAGVSRDEANRL